MVKATNGIILFGTLNDIVLTNCTNSNVAPWWTILILVNVYFSSTSLFIMLAPFIATIKITEMVSRLASIVKIVACSI